MNYGVSEDESAAMMSSGELSGADASAAILSSLAKKYGGMMIEQSRTYTGALSTNEGLVQELQNVMGEAYNGVRKGGLETMNDWYQDNPVMEEAFGVIGVAQADKANLQDALYRDVMNGIFGGQEAQLDLDQGTQDKIDELRTDYLAALEEYQTADEADRMTAAPRSAVSTIRQRRLQKRRTRRMSSWRSGISRRSRPRWASQASWRPSTAMRRLGLTPRRCLKM